MAIQDFVSANRGAVKSVRPVQSASKVESAKRQRKVQPSVSGNKKSHAVLKNSKKYKQTPPKEEDYWNPGWGKFPSANTSCFSGLGSGDETKCLIHTARPRAFGGADLGRGLPFAGGSLPFAPRVPVSP